ncbi:MAG: glycoside hydrolase family 3 C-terminal domain-containing protein [Anaerolineales bacterium]|nr:glycoside hydrolase family 3 C-terminal domain-containing protein [Anaerolineales bacterium]
MENRIESLLAQLTVEEQISLLGGADLWHSVPIPRLAIPVLKVTDGPNGARGSEGSMAPTSADFPVGVALAATWNVELVEKVGQALGQETRAKGAHILLAPTVNIHRSPIAGRNFECYSEDPYLTSRMAIAYILGLQSQGVGACIKHFACNESEFQRTSMSSMITERALREIYLPPFRAALREARPWAVMSAYNKVNEVYCSENRSLLLDILKGEWGFDGIVISDWMGTYSPGVFAGGLDLEMPGPARWSREGAEQFRQQGDAQEFNNLLTDKVRRLLRTLERAGLFENPDPMPEQSLDLPEHRALARQAAAEAIVLLKNHGNLLPIDPARVRSIAVIGSNAHWAAIMGGGSSSVTPHYFVSPLQGIRERAGASITVEYTLGCPINRLPPLLDPKEMLEEGSWNVEFFPTPDFTATPSGATRTDRGGITWSDRFVQGVDGQNFSARLRGTLRVPESGKYLFNLGGNGLYRLEIGGQVVIDHWSGLDLQDHSPWDGKEHNGEIDLQSGQSYPIQITYSWKGKNPWRNLRIGCLPPLPANPIREAVALAQRSDLAIVFVGTTSEWESEGFDRPDMLLPGEQNDLVEAVAAANPHTIVVLTSGSPVSMPWLGRVPVVFQSWLAGQEAGHAIADVLFGDEPPSGKLPTTFPQRLEDTPAYINYPGENGRVYYGEGIFVGYRYYDKKLIEPLFPFGHGLSYTEFTYRNLRLSEDLIRPDENLNFSFEIENSGAYIGKEVVQVYVHDVQSSLVRPPKELKAFAKVALRPGERQSVSFTFGSEALALYDDARHQWVVEPGEFELLVGASSRDIRLRGKFKVESEG